MRDVIAERHLADRRRDLTTQTEVLKTMAKFIAGAAGWEAGVRDADNLNLVPPLKGEQQPVRAVPLAALKAGLG